MTCYCGDTLCPSCGIAQGTLCPDCGGTGADSVGLTDETGRVIDCETCGGTGEACEPLPDDFDTEEDEP